MKNLKKTLDNLSKSITSFLESGYFVDDLYIYAPLWFKELLIEEASKDFFVARIEPLKFMDVEIVSGYENFLIVSNSRKIQVPHKLKNERIEIIIE